MRKTVPQAKYPIEIFQMVQGPICPTTFKREKVDKQVEEFEN